MAVGQVANICHTPSRLPTHGDWGSGRVTAQLENFFFSGSSDAFNDAITSWGNTRKGENERGGGKALWFNTFVSNGDAKLQFSQSVVSDHRGNL